MADTPPLTDPQPPTPSGATTRTPAAFASDNYAGAHPEVLAALALANGGHQFAYGEDVYTEHLQEVLRRHFGAARRGVSRSSTAPAPTSSRSRRSLDRWGAVICAETAHINVDECGAPERVGGLKLLPSRRPTAS